MCSGILQRTKGIDVYSIASCMRYTQLDAIGRRCPSAVALHMGKCLSLKIDAKCI